MTFKDMIICEQTIKQ